MPKFYVVENGRVILLCHVVEEEVSKKEQKITIARAICQALKEVNAEK